MKRTLTINLILLMSLLSFFGCGKQNTIEYEKDTVQAKDGSEIVLTFFSHASISLEWNGIVMYFDPASDSIDWSKLPKADLIFVTHSHFDHFDMAAIDAVKKLSTEVICDKTTADALEHECITMIPGANSEPLEGVRVTAVPAYNISEGHTNFHPKDREDCGYVLSLGGTTIYIAGDTEDNEDVLSLKDIDIAFLPVNQPYTMTVDQVVKVVEQIRPKIFYPYHYGQVDEITDIEALKQRLEGVTEVRVRQLL